MSIRRVEFSKLRAGDMFLFSMMNRVEFMKIGSESCVPMAQSPEILEDIAKGQVVFINKPVEL